MEYGTGNLVDINGGIIVLSGLKNSAVLFTSFSEEREQKHKEIEEVSRFEEKFFSYCIGGGGHQKIGKTNIDYVYTRHFKDLGKNCIVYNSLTNDFIAITHKSLSIAAIDDFITEVNKQYSKKLGQLGGSLKFPYTMKDTPMGAMHDYSYLTIMPLFVGFCLCKLVIE